MESTFNIRLAVPFLMVTDMHASLSFYRDKLGFTLTKEWTPNGRIEWCWLQRDNVSLMLQESRKENWKNIQKVKVFQFASNAGMRLPCMTSSF